MVVTKITSENLDWINQERIKRGINRPKLYLHDFEYLADNFYGASHEHELVSFEKFKQLTNPQTKNQIIELW